MNQSYDKELILELIEKHKIGLSAVTFQDLVTSYPEIANDKEIVSKIQFVENDLFSTVSKELREDEGFLLSLARQNPSYAINIFSNLNSSLSRDVQFIKEIISIDYQIFEIIERDLQLDINLIKAYLLSNPATDRITKIRRLPQHVKDNGEIFRELLQDKFVEGDDLRDFSKKLYEDEDFILSCCVINLDMVNALRVSSKSNFTLVEKAISLNPKTIYFFEYKLEGHQNLISKIVDEAKSYFVLSLPIGLKSLKESISNAVSKKNKEYIV